MHKFHEEWSTMLVDVVDVGAVLVDEAFSELVIKRLSLKDVRQDRVSVVVLLADGDFADIK